MGTGHRLQLATNGVGLQEMGAQTGTVWLSSASHCLPLRGGGGLRPWLLRLRHTHTPTHIRKICQRGPKLEVDFGYTTFFFRPLTLPQKFATKLWPGPQSDKRLPCGSQGSGRSAWQLQCSWRRSGPLSHLETVAALPPTPSPPSRVPVTSLGAGGGNPSAADWPSTCRARHTGGGLGAVAQHFCRQCHGQRTCLFAVPVPGFGLRVFLWVQVPALPPHGDQGTASKGGGGVSS